MKSALQYTLVAVLSLSGLNAFAQGTCPSGNGQNTGVGTAAPYPTNGGYPGGYPTAAQVQQFLGKAPTAGPSARPAAAVAPQARVTVVEAETQSVSGGLNNATASTAARITVVTDDSATGPSSTTTAVAAATASNETLADELKGLVGNWTTVGRYGDNELTTVELQLDDRGWATLTLPGPDGKKSTSKRRVEVKDNEIKLIGQGAATVLGKLVNVSERQMVLENGSSQVTFVRI